MFNRIQDAWKILQGIPTEDQVQLQIALENVGIRDRQIEILATRQQDYDGIVQAQNRLALFLRNHCSANPDSSTKYQYAADLALDILKGRVEASCKFHEKEP